MRGQCPLALLFQDGPNGSVTGICAEDEGLVRVGLEQDQFFQQGFLQSLEGPDLFVLPGDSLGRAFLPVLSVDAQLTC